jgi:hypothetical protein
MKNVMRDFKNQFNGPALEFSFTMEDSGPGLAWLGSKPIVEVVARAVAGQLLIKGIVFEEGTVVPEILHPKFPLPAAGTAGIPPVPMKPFGTVRDAAPVATKPIGK